MSRVSPNPECLPDTMIQTRAKSARIQSLRPLSHESTINPPTLLKKTLEVGLPTSIGFNINIFFYSFALELKHTIFFYIS